jgi:hypothetical protein
MEGSLDFYNKETGSSIMTFTAGGPVMPNPTGARDYYVDGNRSASGDGLSPDTAYATLAEAVAASDISIALTANRWWARRNRIFLMADVTTESLVKFPTKCDVIGIGSYDANDKPGLSGRHLPVGEAYGTRFFNVHFKALAHASPIITLTNASSGIKFIGCTFDGTLGTMTIGIQATASPFMEVIDCDFVGTFVTSYITLGAGEAGRTRILENRMLGTAAKGIVVGGTATASWAPLIQGNLIYATGLTIDDDANIFFVVNNRLITDVDIDGDTAGGIDCKEEYASGNIVTGSGTEGDSDTFPFARIAA